ncbi:unnamed protein product [Merluccius merluccius]
MTSRRCIFMTPLVPETRSQRDEVPSIRRSPLRALDLQVEPQLPMGQLAPGRDHWTHTFSTTGHRSKDPEEYRWPVDLKCNVGERLQRAFVVVPVASATRTTPIYP